MEVKEVERKQSEVIKHCFWVIHFDDKQRFKELTISRSRLIDFLHWKGFAKIKIGGEFRYVIQKDRVFKEISLVEVKDFINHFIQQLANDGEYVPGYESDKVPIAYLREKLIRGTNMYFGSPTLENLPTVQFKPLRDSADAAYVMFRNGFVTVTAEGKKLQPYSELSGDIWHDQISKHEITITELKDPCEFEQFLLAVAGNEERYKSMRSYLGFILHGYRDPSRPQVIVLYDEKEPDKPQDYESAQGGTGKGLLINGLTKLRNTVAIDGKSFKQYGDFPWQRLDVTTQLVAFQDITKAFKFSNLHSVVTDGISVNKKHKAEMFIPFSDSPKFIITTNYIIDTSDDSDRRRIKEIELAPHYSPEHTPKDEFGHLLFDDWDNDEWMRFYNLMMGYIETYLKDGFIDPPASMAAAERKFILKYGQEVLDVLNGLQISTTRDHVNGVRHITSDVREKCKDQGAESMTGSQFAQALKNYCMLAHDVEPPLESWSSGGKRYFILYGKNKRDISYE